MHLHYLPRNGSGMERYGWLAGLTNLSGKELRQVRVNKFDGLPGFLLCPNHPCEAASKSPTSFDLGVPRKSSRAGDEIYGEG